MSESKLNTEAMEAAARLLELRNNGVAAFSPEQVADAYVLAEGFADAVSDVLRVTLPNPLWIELGEGRVLISRFSMPEGNGLVFRESEVAHEVGEYLDIPDQRHEPETGEVFILCTNVESAKVLKQQAAEVVRAFDIRAIPVAKK